MASLSGGPSMRAMSVDLGVMGREYGPWEKSWTRDDVMLYALAVGCGWDDLRFVTENSEDIDLEVLPTFAVKVGIAGPGFSFADFGDVAMESIVHGEQRIEFAGPIPVEGSVRVAGRITDVPHHGILARIRQQIADDRLAGVVAPELATEAPVWLAASDAGGAGS